MNCANYSTDKNNITPIHVLNPRGRDAHCDYRGGIGGPNANRHAPVNYHAYAAATGGVYSPDWRRLPKDGLVLLLLRRRLPLCLRTLRQLKQQGRTVFLSWKETAPHQVAAQLRRWGNKRTFLTLLKETNGLIAPTSWAAEFFQQHMTDNSIERPLITIPTPYPIEDENWTFSRPLIERSGILVGTREWNIASRQHEKAVKLALMLAKQSGCHVTVVHTSGTKERKHLQTMASSQPEALRIIDGPLPYPSWLTLLAQHRLLLQCDASRTPGQVAGDSLLAGLPCAGGNGTIERTVFNSLGNDDGSFDPQQCLTLLEDDKLWEDTMSNARKIAMDTISFTAFRNHWAEFHLPKQP